MRILLTTVLMAMIVGCTTTLPPKEVPLAELEAKRERLRQDMIQKSVIVSKWYANQARAVHELEVGLGTKLGAVSKRRSPEDILAEQSNALQSLLTKLESLQKETRKIDSEIKQRTPNK
jgi:hypothetical protein